MKIVDFSNLSVVRAAVLNGSVIRLYFESCKLSEKSVVRTCEITLDFCIWELYQRRVVLFDSESEQLSSEIQIVLGATLDYVKWVVGFNSLVNRNLSPYLSLRFTNGLMFRIWDHPVCESDLPEMHDDAPLMTFFDGKFVFQFMSHGTISAHEGKWT